MSCLDVSAPSEIGPGISEDSLSSQLDVSCITLLKADILSCVSLNWYLACYMASLAICHPYILPPCVTALVRHADFLPTKTAVTLSKVAVGEVVITCS